MNQLVDYFEEHDLSVLYEPRVHIYHKKIVLSLNQYKWYMVNISLYHQLLSPLTGFSYNLLNILIYSAESFHLKVSIAHAHV